MYKKILIFLVAIHLSGNLFPEETIHQKITKLENKLSQVTGPEKVDLLNQLALNYASLAPQKCIEYGQQALELSQKTNYELGLATALYSLATGYMCLGDNEQALTHYQAALKKQERLGNKEGMAKTMSGIGSIYNDLGQYDQAMEFQKRSMTLFEELGDQGNMASSLTDVAMIYFRLDDYEQTLKYLQKSLKIMEEVGDTTGIAVAAANLGVTHLYLSHYEQAVECHLRAKKIFEELGDKRNLSTSHYSIALIYYETSKYELALEYLRKALSIEEEMGDLKGVSQILNVIGLVYENLAQYEKALEYYTNSLSRGEGITDQRGQAATLSNIGNIHFTLGDSGKALEYQHLALLKQEEIGDKRGIARTLSNIGSIYHRTQSEHEALEHFLKSLHILEEINDTGGIAVSLFNIGSLYYDLNKDADSLNYFNQSLALSQAIENPKLEWQAHARIALYYKEQQDLNSALDHYQEAIRILESIRAQLQQEEHKSGYMLKKIEVYEDVVQTLIQLDRARPNQGFDKVSFYYAEKAKARVLFENLHEAHITKIPLNRELRAQELSISRKISTIMNQLQRTGLSKGQRKSLLHKLGRAEEDYNAFIIEVRRRNPRYGRSLYPQPYTVTQIQQELPDPKTALIEYFVGEESMLMFLIKKDTFSVHQVPVSPNFNESIQFYLKLLSSQQDKKGEKIPRIRTAERLFKELVGPFHIKLHDVDNLIIIPDGILHYLPFETLLSGENGRNQFHSNKIRYLIEDFKISYAPSASVLVDLAHLKSPHQTTKDLLAFGNPNYHKPLSLEKIVGHIFRDYYLEQGLTLSSLVHTEREVTEIARLFAKNRCDIFLGPQASEDTLKQLSLRDYNIIHFASHGFLDDNFFHRSALVLTLDEDPAEDGFLQVREIYQLQLNTNLVVLSACQTGKGKLERGEGVFGLTRAFLSAGAQSVVSTLWNIDDQASSDFMNHFYDYLLAGKSKTQALQLAKLRMINSSYGHPFYWAAFVLNGECCSTLIRSTNKHRP